MDFFLRWHFYEQGNIARQTETKQWHEHVTKKASWEKKEPASAAIALAALILIKDLKQHPLTLNDLPQQQFVCISISFSALSSAQFCSRCLFPELECDKVIDGIFSCAPHTPHHTTPVLMIFHLFAVFLYFLFLSFSLNPGTLSIKQLLEKKICVCMYTAISPD